MHIFKVTKSADAETARLELYDGSLALLESESFSDLYTLNFQLQTFAKKYRSSGILVIVHDKSANSVVLSMAKDENSLFVS